VLDNSKPPKIRGLKVSLFLIAGTLLAQPGFEVASVKANRSGSGRGVFVRGRKTHGGKPNDIPR
jgi:hypothetical protein